MVCQKGGSSKSWRPKMLTRVPASARSKETTPSSYRADPFSLFRVFHEMR